MTTERTAYVLDLETHLIQPGAYIPKPVAGSLCLISEAEGIGEAKPVTIDYLSRLLRTHAFSDEPQVRQTLFIGARVAFDLSVMAVHAPECAPAVWELYKQGRVSDVQIREKLIALRAGELGNPALRFNLDALAKKYLGVDIGADKHGQSSWRLRFAELDGVPFAQWPAEVMQYMLNDATITATVWAAQCGAKEIRPDFFIPDEERQVRAAFALQWISAYGLIADPEAVAEVKADLQAEMQRHEAALLEQGILKPKKGGGYSKDTKTIHAWVENDPVWAKAGMQAPRTEPSPKFPAGQVKADDATLALCESPNLAALREYASAQSIMSKFVTGVLEVACTRPMHPSFDELKETGRTSSYGNVAADGLAMGFNCQQLPRKGGIRECFVPRPGNVFIGCDYSYIEICCLAQVLYSFYGESRMRDALVAGHDPHCVTAAALLGITVEEFNRRLALDDDTCVEMRQFAKIPNFGLPGGLGAETFVAFAKGYEVSLTLEQAVQTKQGWLAAYPEMAYYFKTVGSLCDNPDGVASVQQLFTERVRGRAGYTQICNTFFQGLAADGLKESLFLIAEESLNQPESPLYGTYMAVEAHDEVIAESPRHKAAAAAKRLSELMVQGMKKFCPDVPVQAQPVIMERWYKGAKPAFDAQGNLIPWRPKEK